MRSGRNTPKELWGRLKQLLVRLLPDRCKTRQAAISEAEYKRQALIALRQRLRSGLHQRLGK